MNDRRRTAQAIRDELQFVRAFTPDSLRIPDLQTELAEANRVERERRAARKAVLKGILTATHVRLADGWVEVVSVDAPRHAVVVANGENRAEMVPVAKVLEVRSL
jgi:hypothetical protein